ncbi:hypothetical protein SKAU_G00086450 [Synaphobranchus kaupii]|uniref:Uncharacterized protein n=1 Tax=Synaphobranchus kaupii TaxID=118154 RepID=A0A9Q1FW77_SYNKA|nr:hypothetical protein SKAU_G00086450 [Synaphobranchus kaupii]
MTITKIRTLSLKGEAPFYRGLLGVRGQADVVASAVPVSAVRLLEEPLVCGPWPEVPTAATPGLSDTSKGANPVTLGHLAELAGSSLADAGRSAERLHEVYAGGWPDAGAECL